jgi:hypothetical protein
MLAETAVGAFNERMKTNATTLEAPQSKLHPFESAGMGRGPYRWVGMVEMPNLSEDGAATFGGGNPYAEVQSYNMKAGAGTCACCGMAISIVCVVRDADGNNWGVGSDCIEKAGDSHIGNYAEIAIRQRRNAKASQRREAKRQANHAAWLIAPSRENPSETNQQRIDRQNAERKAREQSYQAEVDARKVQFADVLNVLTGNDFYKSLAEQLSRGPLSQRQAECAAKAVLGRWTKKNNDEVIELIARLTEVTK